MKCEKCGKPIPEGIDYCPSCSLAENSSYIKYMEEKNNKEETKEKVGEVYIPDAESDEVKKESPAEGASFIVYCECGQKLDPNWKVCPKCGKPVSLEIQAKDAKPVDSGSATIYIIISIASFAVGWFVTPFGFLVALITIIAGRIACPNNTAVKVLFWVMIVCFVLYVIFLMWMMVLCTQAAQSCG
jgi:uncharacterized membrane protein YvbJ